ncbi:MAG: hypothetical protein ACLQUY_24065 [Ktedonobacterales bacterium]
MATEFLEGAVKVYSVVSTARELDSLVEAEAAKKQQQQQQFDEYRPTDDGHPQARTQENLTQQVSTPRVPFAEDVRFR